MCTEYAGDCHLHHSILWLQSISCRWDVPIRLVWLGEVYGIDAVPHFIRKSHALSSC